MGKMYETSNLYVTPHSKSKTDYEILREFCVITHQKKCIVQYSLMVNVTSYVAFQVIWCRRMFDQVQLAKNFSISTNPRDRNKKLANHKSFICSLLMNALTEHRLIWLTILKRIAFLKEYVQQFVCAYCTQNGVAFSDWGYCMLDSTIFRPQHKPMHVHLIHDYV